jgi:hypothetical protein
MCTGRHVAAFFLNACSTIVSSTMLFLRMLACITRTIIRIYYTRSNGPLIILLIFVWRSGRLRILRILLMIICTATRNFGKLNCCTNIMLLTFAIRNITIIAIVNLLIIINAAVGRRG